MRLNLTCKAYAVAQEGSKGQFIASVVAGLQETLQKMERQGGTNVVGCTFRALSIDGVDSRERKIQVCNNSRQPSDVKLRVRAIRNSTFWPGHAGSFPKTSFPIL